MWIIKSKQGVVITGCTKSSFWLHES